MIGSNQESSIFAMSIKNEDKDTKKIDKGTLTD